MKKSLTLCNLIKEGNVILFFNLTIFLTFNDLHLNSLIGLAIGAYLGDRGGGKMPPPPCEMKIKKGGK